MNDVIDPLNGAIAICSSNEMGLRAVNSEVRRAGMRLNEHVHS